MTDSPARRRRRRGPQRPDEVAPAPATAVTAPVADQLEATPDSPRSAEPGPAPEGALDAGSGRRGGRQNRRSEERGWRDLAGSGPSQVGTSGALRARDVARPEEADLAAAEQELVIVRRQWKPLED